MIFIENVLGVFVGASLAFIFNFLLQEYKMEKMDLERKIISLEILEMLTADLCAILDLNPDNYPHFKVDPYEIGFASLVEIKESKDLYSQLKKHYRHWRNKNYCEGGPNCKNVLDDKGLLEGIGNKLKKLRNVEQEKYTGRSKLGEWLFIKIKLRR